MATAFGKFTVAVNNTPWTAIFTVVTDLRISPDGRTIAAQSSEDNTNFRILVNGQVWPGVFDMVYGPVICPVTGKVAARVEKNGRQAFLLDGKAFGETFERAFDPVFSPDGGKVLLRGISGGKYQRIVAPAEAFKG